MPSAYFELKRSIQKIIENNKLRSKPDAPFDPKTLEPVIEGGSKLRTYLSWDVGTRRESMLSES